LKALTTHQVPSLLVEELLALTIIDVSYELLCMTFVGWYHL